MGAEHDIEVRQLLGELLAVALADATPYRDIALVERRALAHGDILHGGHLPVEARIGRLAYAARQKHNDIGLLDGGDGQRAQSFQHAGYALGIVLVHLAAESMDAEGGPFEMSAHGLSESIDLGNRRVLGCDGRSGKPRTGLDGETDGRAVLAVDDDIGERGNAADLDAHRREKPA